MRVVARRALGGLVVAAFAAAGTGCVTVNDDGMHHKTEEAASDGTAGRRPPSAAGEPLVQDKARPLLDTTASARGVDADGDGIRDDVRRLIDTAPLPEATKRSARQLARAIQLRLVDTPTTSAAALAQLQKEWEAAECLNRVDAVFGEHIQIELYADTFNTPQRQAVKAATDRLFVELGPVTTKDRSALACE